MRPSILIVVAAIGMAGPAAHAGEKRELGAHVHNAGSLGIAIEGRALAMTFEAPGADIVGFEHKAASGEQRAGIDDAIAALSKPLDLFVLPAAAGCTVTDVHVRLALGDEGADDHGHEGKHEEAHGDKGHSDKAHGDRAHDTEAAHEADAHEQDGHSEFHAEYVLDCADTAALDSIVFAYFTRFPAAEELDVQLLSAQGARAFEVRKAAPMLDLRGLI